MEARIPLAPPLSSKEHDRKAMKVLRLIAGTLFVVAIATIPAFAQQRQAAKPATSPTPAQSGGTTAVIAKIAFINTDEFKNEKTGILRWLAAAKSVQREFEPLQKELEALEARIQTLIKELETLRKSAVVDPKTITGKQEEIARLQREQKFKKDDGEARLNKRYDEVVGPVSADIGKALDVFAKQRGITLLLEYTTMMGAILSADKSTDLTAAFIAEYNSKNPVTGPTAAPVR
jgi:Skp family chaperone for outer membrane proteins